MRDGVPDLQSAAADLGRIFDESFAREAVSSQVDCEHFLAIRAAGEPFAVRTLDISELIRGKRVVSVPSGMPEALGIAAVRGTLVPVYELARLLGLSSTGNRQSWLIVINREAPIALAFEEFEGQVDVLQPAVYDDDRPESQTYVRQMVRMGSGVRAVLDVRAIVSSISKRVEALKPVKESVR